MVTENLVEDVDGRRVLAKTVLAHAIDHINNTKRTMSPRLCGYL